MEYSKSFISAYQIVEYLVCEHNYQIMRLANEKHEIWLTNPKQKLYPVIHVIYERDDDSSWDGYVYPVFMMLYSLIQKQGEPLELSTTEDTVNHDVPLKQIFVHDGGVSDVSILKYFPKLNIVLHDVEDIQNEIVHISGHIESAQLKNQKKLLKSALKKLYPYLTFFLILVCSTYTILSFLLSLQLNSFFGGWILSGCYYKMNIIACNEYFRLFTSMFIQGDAFLFPVSMYALYMVGKITEPIFKKNQFLMIFIISGLVGNIFMLVSEVNTIGFGAGASIFGLTGAYFAWVLEGKRYESLFIQKILFRFVMINMLLCLLPGISVFSHIGGGISGFLLGILFSRKKEWHFIRLQTCLAFFIFIVGIVFLSFRTQNVEPLEKNVDKQLIEIFKEHGYTNYADALNKAYNEQYKMQ